ncbi:SMI1/KNR4 family protein [Christensenellaceae bacterium 44-20]
MTKNSYSNFRFNSPATLEEINKLKNYLGINLPEDYFSFMMKNNGGEGWIEKKYLILWPIEKLLFYNKAYQVYKYAPGLLIFGSNGGLEAFAFDTTVTPVKIVSIPFIGLTPSEAIEYGVSFQEFITRI